jgi:hypothetical protein
VILCEFEVVLKRKVIPSVSNYPYERVGEIWTSRRSPIRISKCGCLKILLNKKMMGPTCQSQAPLKTAPGRWSCMHVPIHHSNCTGTDRASCRSNSPHPPPGFHAQRMQSPPRASSPLAVGPKEKPVLSSSRSNRRALTHSALPLAVRLCSKRRALATAHRSCAPLSHTKPVTEPPSSARNR